MNHLAPLIRDLAIILGTAGVVSAIFQRLRQPVVLGYLVAGILVGSLGREWRLLSDLPNVRVWGELGVIFLMFSLGLEFSFRKLSRLGLGSAGTALIEMSALFGIGFLVTRHLLGWRLMESVFAGAMVSVSSTTIILKAFGELGLKSRRFAEGTFGVLVFEDLVAIILMVALTTVSQAKALSGMMILGSAAKLILVVGTWFLVGYFAVPRLMRLAGRTGSDEMLTVLATGLCLGLVVLANSAGYSVALGAFIMGSILAETTESQRIEELITPLRDVFAAIFFVSIGMLLDLPGLYRWWPEALVFIAIIIAGKAVFVTLGSLLTGQTLSTSIQIGLAMAQIGEFSFILAGLASSSGPRARMLYPLAVVSCLVTSLTTPMLIRKSHRIADRIEERLPIRAREFLNRYAFWVQERRTDREKRADFYRALFRWFACGILVTAIHVLLSERTPIEGSLPVRWILATLGSAPFLWAMLRSFQSVGRAFSFGLLTVIWVGLLAREFFPTWIAFSLTVGLSTLLFFSYFRRLEDSYRWFERELLSAFRGDQPKSGRKTDLLRTLAPWDAHLVRIKVHPNSPLAGRRIVELSLRTRLGLNIVVIRRGVKHLVAPSPDTVVFPKDELLVLGTDEQVELARAELERPPGLDERFEPVTGYELRNVLIQPDSQLAGRSIRQSGIRERFGAMVVGIERGGQRMLNPDTDLTIETGDLLWLVGETERLEALKGELQLTPEVASDSMPTL